jgi:hypothetical protein
VELYDRRGGISSLRSSFALARRRDIRGAWSRAGTAARLLDTLFWLEDDAGLPASVLASDISRAEAVGEKAFPRCNATQLSLV